VDKDFHSLLLGRFKQNTSSECLTDIYDGEAYKKKEFLKNPLNFSLTMNTDGAPVFKSTGIKLWPVYFIINELPPNLRFSRKYTLLAGLWSAPEDPPMFQYLRPLMERCKSLETTGMEVPIGPDGDIKCCKVMVCVHLLISHAKPNC
jgi:hypothetical protein